MGAARLAWVRTRNCDKWRVTRLLFCRHDHHRGCPVLRAVCEGRVRCCWQHVGFCTVLETTRCERSLFLATLAVSKGEWKSGSHKLEPIRGNLSCYRQHRNRPCTNRKDGAPPASKLEWKAKPRKYGPPAKFCTRGEYGSAKLRKRLGPPDDERNRDFSPVVYSERRIARPQLSSAAGFSD